MTTTLILTDNDTIKVEYKTDLPIGATTGNFTIMDILDLSDAEKHLGLDFKQLPSDVDSFKNFAEANNLALIRTDDNGNEVIVNYVEDSSSDVIWW